jgi:hypothetical protein
MQQNATPTYQKKKVIGSWQSAGNSILFIESNSALNMQLN